MENIFIGLNFYVKAQKDIKDQITLYKFQIVEYKELMKNFIKKQQKVKHIKNKDI